MNISIICMGKLKEAYWRDAVAEYAKRIGAYADFGVTELAEAKLSDKPSQKEIDAALAAEGKTIIERMKAKGAYNIAMCIEGRQTSSEGLANIIQTAAVNGSSRINFIIGSSYGLCDEVKRLADFKLSISQMTLPHQLARVILAEQIYRALSIISHSKYHK